MAGQLCRPAIHMSLPTIPTTERSALAHWCDGRSSRLRISVETALDRLIHQVDRANPAHHPIDWTRLSSFAKISPVTSPTPNEVLRSEKIAVPQRAESLSTRLKLLNWSGICFAILQSACTAVIAISGVRVAIGLSALAAAAGIHHPARGFHQDAIRIPMMLFALFGSLINLFVIWKIRNLRSKPASQWRRQPVTAKKLNSERFQIALSIFTLILLAAEWITHPMVHRVP